MREGDGFKTLMSPSSFSERLKVGSYFELSSDGWDRRDLISYSYD